MARPDIRTMFEWLSRFLPTRNRGAGGEQRSTSYSLKDFIPFFGNTSTSGAAVTTETALTHATVYACCKVLSESVATLPLKLHSYDGMRTEIAYDRPEHRLMAVSPSDIYTSYQFRATMMMHVCLRGNAYARIYRDGRGTARSLFILRPDMVRPYLYEGKLFYEVTTILTDNSGGTTETLHADDVLHFKIGSTDGIRGRSPITVLRDTIGYGLTAREAGGKQLKDGTMRGLLKHPHKLTTEQTNSLREHFSNAMQQGRVPILENGVDFMTTHLSLADAEYLGSVKINTEQITGAFRVPAHMIGNLERSTNNNIVQQSLEFVKYTLLPYLTNFEAELNRKIIPYSLQSRYSFKFNVDALLRADIQTRMSSHATAIQWGIMNRDEVRALEDLNPIPDGLGQVFLSPLNMVPIEQQANAADDAEADAETDEEKQQQANN